MLKISYRLFVMLVAAAAVSCASADTEPASGILGMGSLEAVVSADDAPQATRAVDTGDFIIRIRNARQEIAGEWTVPDRPPEITLQAGVYTLEVCSPELPGAGWESPWYAATESFTIAGRDRVDIGQVVCRLANIRVTVHYSEAMKELMNGDSNVTVEIGGNQLSYSFAERRSGYFAAPGETADMTIRFEGTVDNVWETYTHTIGGVSPGEWERVRFTFEENEGERTFLVTVYGSEAGQIGEGGEWF